MLIHIAAGSSESSLSIIVPEDIQPNAIDLRLDRVFKFVDTDFFAISEDHKRHAKKVEVSPNPENFFVLQPGVYEVQFQGVIKIGPNEAGWVITRSTLNRNGVFITSGLYDSGYEGAMAGALHVSAVPATIEKGTRIGQFILFKAQALHSYNGSYGLDADGKPKADEAVYHKDAN